MNTQATYSPPRSNAWFWSPTLDLTLTLGVLSLALILGGLGLISEDLFYLVLWFDVWFIAHPHLAAMYTRLVLDRESAQRARQLLMVAPLITLAATAAVSVGLGSLWLITGYYVWQTWHYTRQSYGVMRALSPTVEPSPITRTHHELNDKLASGVIYGFPIWGLLHRAHRGADLFYGWPIYLPPVSPSAVYIAGGVSLTLLVAWGAHRLMWAVQSELGLIGALTRSATQSGLILSHVLITVVSYLWVEEITQGWLFINIWHNLQYLVFVWAYNARRVARDELDPLNAVRLISLPTWASVTRYFTLCLISGTLFFLGVDALIEVAHSLSGLLSEGYAQGASLLLVVHLSINFHHYIVDARIWTRGYMMKR